MIDTLVAPFRFLVEKHGFSGPHYKQVAYEFHHVFTRRGVELDVWCDGSKRPYLSMRGGDLPGWRDLSELDARGHLSNPNLEWDEYLEGYVHFLDGHPEILEGKIGQLLAQASARRS